MHKILRKRDGIGSAGECSAQPAEPGCFSLVKVVFLSISLFGMAAWSEAAYADLCQSIASGNWDVAANWNNCGGSFPTANDDAVINGGHTITIAANVAVRSVLVNLNGMLRGNGAVGSPWTLSYGKGGQEDFTINGIVDFGPGSEVTLVLDKNSIWGGAGTWNLSQLNYANRTLTLAGAATDVVQVNFSGNATPITGTTGFVTSLPATIWNFTGTTSQTLPATANVRFGSINVSVTDLPLPAPPTTVTLGMALNTANLQGNFLTVESGTLNNGGFAIDGGGVVGKTFSVANGATFNLTGTSTMATGFANRMFGQGTPASTPPCSTVNYAGTAQTVSNEAYGNLVLSGSGVKTMPSLAMAIACDFTMAATATATAAQALTVGGNFTIGSTNTFSADIFSHSVGGNWTNNGAFNGGTSTVTFNGTAAQTLAGSIVTTFNNLVIANTVAAVSATTNFNTNGTLTVNANAVLSPTAAVIVGGAGTLTGAGTVQVTTLAAGGFNSQYTIAGKTMTDLTVEYAGAGAQTVSVITYGSGTGGGLKISNASGVSLTADTTVAGTLTLFNGVVNAGTFTLLTTGNCTTTLQRTSGWVAGKLQLSFPTGSPTCTYHVGDATNYRPILQAYASVSAAGVMVGNVSQGAGDHPNIATSGLDSTLGVNRYWTLTKPTGSAIAYTTYTATFTFVASDVDAGADPLTFEVEASLGGGATWTLATVGTRTATSTQASGIGVPNTANTFYDFSVSKKKVTTPGGFVSYDTTTAPATAIDGNLKTKIAGAAFTFDIGALNPAKTALLATFVGPVKVELLDSSDNSGLLDATTACRSSWTVAIQTLTDQTFNAAGDLAITGASGRHRVTPVVTENNAWKDVRVRVSYPVVSPTVIGCSTDNFAIRPNDLVVSTTDATWQTAGITRALNNAVATGGNVHKAGQPFTIRATAYNAAGTPGVTGNYNGTPTVETLVCTLPASCASGTLTPGVWSASGGIITTTTATYSEAGAFNLTLQDRTYAAVDASDGTLADCTASGYYICPATASAVGRFVPDHFDMAALALTTPIFLTFNTTNALCSAGGRSFTYIGQPFWYQTLPQATILARNAAGVTTTNYKGTLWKVAATDITQTYSNNAVGPALDTSLLIGSPSVTDNANGTGTVEPAPTDKLGYQRSTTTPVAPFSANLSLAVSAQDASENAANQGIITSSSAVTFNGTGTGIAFDAGNAFRYGRLRLSNAHGSELLRLPIPLQAQYWDGTAFVTNSADNCTRLLPGNIGITTTLPGITAATGGAFVSGVGTLSLSKPSPTATGYADVCVDLGTDPGAGTGTACSAASASRSYLQGLWAPGTNYDNDPVARATYGVYKGATELIYMRENY